MGAAYTRQVLFRRKPIPLPPGRFRMGGAHFKDDAEFIRTAVADVERLQARAGLTKRSTLLDWGCGAGRLAVGVKHRWGHVRDYHGVDVQPKVLGWAKRNLSDKHTRFTLVDVANARYNPDGSLQRHIPAEPDSIDVFYAYSVWSHMTPDDVAGYAEIIARILKPTGRAMLTAFVEDDVPDWSENPEGYGPLEWRKPLHCARFERGYFYRILDEAGLRVVDTDHGTETDGQSLFILARR